MADNQIVSCPGCGKRYSVPPGVAPGQFQCQDCSAVVVYGRNAAPPGPARPHGGSARSHAKAAAARKKLARERGRRDEESDEEAEERRGGHGDHGPKQQSPMPYVLGFVALGVLAAVIAFAANKSGKAPAVPSTARQGQKVPDAPGTVPLQAIDQASAGGGAGSHPGPAPAPVPAPAPAAGSEAPPLTGGIRSAVRGGIEEKKDAFKEAAHPPTGGNYGKSQAALLTMLKEDRFSVVMDLGQLPDTAPELAQKIDADVIKISDPMGGGDAIRAMDRLVKVGRPALPRILGIVSKLDYSKFPKVIEARDACVLGDAVDSLMRDITGFDKFTRLQFSPNAKLEDYTHTIDSWFVWWYTTGYKRETFYKPEAAEGEEKL
jgi:hypothetical protein